MYIDKNGTLYQGDMQPGDREATSTEISEWQRLQVIAQITSAIQKRLDDFAGTRGYDDMKSLVSYAGDPDPQFNKEGAYGKSVRSQTWATSRGILADVTAGRRPLPNSIADIQADLPPLVWPA